LTRRAARHTSIRQPEDNYVDGTTSSLAPAIRAGKEDLAFANDTRAPGVLEQAYREMLSPRMIGVALTVLVGVIAMFTVIGPVSTLETLAAHRRLAYFALCVCLSSPICYSKSVLTLYFMRSRSSRTITLALVGATLAAAVPVTGIVSSIEMLLRPAYFRALVAPTPVASLLKHYLMVTAVMLSSSFLNHYIVCQRVRLNAARASFVSVERTAVPAPGRAGADAAEHDAEDSAVARGAADTGAVRAPAALETSSTVAERTPDTVVEVASSPEPSRAGAATGPQFITAGAPPALCERLPRRLGCDLIYITVDDHYVEAHTPAGSAIVLLPFSAAIADLGDRGLQVHRSYWASFRHMRRLVRKEARTYLHLTGGTEIPVSRTYLAAVRTAVSGSETAGPTNPVE